MTDDYENGLTGENENADNNQENIDNTSEVYEANEVISTEQEANENVPYEDTQLDIEGQTGSPFEAASEPQAKVRAEIPFEEAAGESSEAPSYSYASPESRGSANYVWDDSTKAVPKKSSRGFKVFTAVMLSVFTLSIAAIAALTAVNYIKTSGNVESSSVTAERSVAADTTVNGAIALPISTFKVEEGELTKAQVAAKTSPSAVGVVVEKEYSQSNSYFGYFGYFSNTPQIIQGAGSGFIYSTDGYIITNHHVIEDSTKITVHFNDGTTADATLVGSDELTDIAVIKVDTEGLNLIPMEIGDSDKLVVGDEVIAIGCPSGIELMGTVTDGIISAINRDIALTSGSAKKTMTLLQTNATINRGNSGGPLINSKGQVIGINTLKLASDYEGIGFAIPINGALPIIRQIIEHGEVVDRSDNSFVSSEGIIGISASAISESDANYYGIPRGVLVVQIDKDSSAAKAGLRRGDIITAYNGTEVLSVPELNSLKSKNKAGDTVTVTVYRDSDSDSEKGETFDISFKLDAAK